ncbi:outer membrane protein assembly factor BamD [Rickettsia endosymbiont of Culicoides newsteadi]|uniref:outer membrane protein assembly factor BamD n=1 Tax=Rickettsia endosymbiont of Culicoides newsteadi TaxID=1961830 RepID=UPI000B9B1FF0|nr:outer membrane protein assembly factor BamD [Rickettsia endosymbiont of Culicoides newsteadi]
MKLAKLLFYTITTCLILSGCKTKKTDEDLIVPAPELYNDGLILLEKQQYLKAAEEFSRIFYQDPGNKMTPQAELMQSYSLFLGGQYEEAVDVLDSFIKLHPMHEDIAYAYYLKALSYYMQVSNVQLDQSRTFLAKKSFEDVIRLFPKTKYSIDAALKIDLVNDHLAGKEMDVGRYYLMQNNPIAAINRFQIIVDDYQTTSHIPEALYRLVESYLMLGLSNEAKKYAAVLGHNYPDSTWYKYCYSLINNSLKE